MPDTPDDVVLTIPVQDGQYHIHTRSAAGEPAWPGTPDGLLVGDDTGLTVLTGTQWGPVAVALRAHDTRPGSVELGWDMAAERSLDIAGGEIVVGGTTVTVHGERAGIRVSVRGRRAAAQRAEQGEAVLREPVEEHLIQYWPTARRDDATVLIGPDDVATMILEQQERLRRDYR